MPVFPAYYVTQLTDRLREMASAYFAQTALPLTGDEFAEAFISPDHIDKLREVRALVGSGNDKLFFESPYQVLVPPSALLPLPALDTVRMSVQVNFAAEVPFLVPQYVSTGFQALGPDLARKIDEWALQRVQISLAVCVGASAIRYLSQACSNARAVAVMFPALATIAARIDDSDRRGESTGTSAKRAMKFGSSKSVGEMAALPPEIRRMIYAASQMINAMVLAENAPAVPQPRGGALLLGSSVKVPCEIDQAFAKATGSNLYL